MYLFAFKGGRKENFTQKNDSLSMSEWKLSGLDHFLFTSLGQQPGLSTCNSLSYGPTRTKAFLTSSPGNIPSAFRSVGTLLWGTLMAREGRWGQPFKSSLIFNIPNDFCFDSDFPQELKVTLGRPYSGATVWSFLRCWIDLISQLTGLLMSIFISWIDKWKKNTFPLSCRRKDKSPCQLGG